MRRNLTRILGIVLAAAMIISLAACSNGTGTASTTAAAATTAAPAATTAAAAATTAAAAATTAAPAATTAAPAATTAAATTAAATTAPASAGEAMTINWVGAEYGPVDDDGRVRLMVEEMFNVKFNLIYVEAGTYAEQIGLLFASDEVPDVFQAKSLTSYREWANQEMLMPLDLDKLTQYAPNMMQELEYWSDYVKFDLWDTVRIDGEIYGVPMLNADGMYPSIIVYRDDWLANVGLEAPETLDQYEDMLYAFTKNDPDGNGKDDTYGLSNTAMNAFYGTSGYYPTFWSYKGNEVVYGAIQPEMQEVLAMFAKWYADGVLDPEYATGENTGGYWAISHSFDNGRIGMTCMGSYYHWNPPYYEGHSGGSNYQPFKEINPDGTYAFAKQVPLKDGVGGMTAGLGNTGAEFVMGYQVEDNEALLAKILEIIDYAATDFHYYVTIKTGIEGTDWVFDENGVVVTTEAYQKAAEAYGGLSYAASIGCSNCFCPWQSMLFYKQQQKFQFEFADSTVGYYNKMINVKQLTMPSEPDLITDLDTLRSTAWADFITGARPIDQFDDFCQEWLKMGGQTLTDEMNAQYGK